jgi:hypothetical protein
MANPIVTSAAEEDYSEALAWHVEQSVISAEGFKLNFSAF